MLIRSLSARLLVLTIFFVMLCEVLVFVPSVARYRMAYLDDHIASAHLATLALVASPTGTLDPALTSELLRQVGARAIFLRRANGMVRMLDTTPPPTPDVTFDVSKGNVPRWIMMSWQTLLSDGNRIMRVIGELPFEPGTTVVVLLPEAPLRAELWDFGGRIFRLSLGISLATAVLVYLSLQWMLVRPMRRITESMTAFRQEPEDASRSIAPSRRSDEIGRAQSELAMLQQTVREALTQHTRLAALGTAVTKINHDLRSILATARLVSDGLADSAAPEVRRAYPRLLEAIDRAVALCTQTLDFSREGAPPFSPSTFPLQALIDEIPQALGLGEDELTVELAIPEKLRVRADRDQLYRVFLNLTRNAVEAGARKLVFRASREQSAISVEVEDNGPGLPPRAQENLFRPFFGSGRPGGSGLGLAIARELMRGQGGEIALVETTGTGTVFRLTLPAAREPALSRSSK